MRARGVCRGGMGQSVLTTGFSRVDGTMHCEDVSLQRIADEIRLHAAKRGVELSEFTLVAFGGAGPVHAAAVAEVKGGEAGLAALDAIDLDTIRNYQPYWAVRAHLLRQGGKEDEARKAFERAISLAEDPAVRQFLLERRG